MQSIFNRLIITSALALAISCAPKAAAELLAHEHHDGVFDQIASNIVNNSAELKALKSKLYGETADIQAANLPPDPEVEFEHLWSASPLEDNKWNISVTQQFDMPWVYVARHSLLHKALRNADIELQAARHEMLDKVRALLVDIVAEKKRIAIYERISTNTSELKEKYATAFTHGETNILDINKIEIEFIQAESDLAEARAALAALIAELGTIATCNVTELVAELDEFPMRNLLPLDAYLQSTDNVPEFLAAKSRVDMANAVMRTNKATRWPMLTAGYVHAHEDGTHFNGLSVGMTLPVWSRRAANRGNASRAMAAEFEVIAMRSAIEAGIRADYTTASRLKNLADKYGPVIESTDAPALLRRALDGGQISLLEYLQELNYFIQAHLTYVNINRDYHKALISLCAHLNAH